MSDAARITGTWTLASFVTEFEDGSRLLPYGPGAAGRITYTADGFMSAHLWDPDRHREGAEPGGDPAYFAYCGSWTVSGRTVRHRVHAATDPAWTGALRLRTLAWRGDDLELVAEGVEFGGKTGRGVLLWRRL